MLLNSFLIFIGNGVYYIIATSAMLFKPDEHAFSILAANE